MAGTLRRYALCVADGIAGSLTAKGLTMNVSANIIDLLGETNTLCGLMGNIEGRKDRYAMHLDVVYTNLSGSLGGTLQSTPFARTSVSANATASVTSTVVITEGAVGYELYRSHAVSMNGATSSDGWTSAIDAIAGARWWHTTTDVSVGVNIDVSRSARLVSFDAGRSLALASTGVLDWVGPFVGLRLRQRLAPRHEIDLQGDVGGFGVGSQFTWQVRAGYSYTFSVGKTSWAGLIGHRALGVNYVTGNNDGINAVLNGPVVGLNRNSEHAGSQCRHASSARSTGNGERETNDSIFRHIG